MWEFAKEKSLFGLLSPPSGVSVRASETAVARESSRLQVESIVKDCQHPPAQMNTIKTSKKNSHATRLKLKQKLSWKLKLKLESKLCRWSSAPAHAPSCVGWGTDRTVVSGGRERGGGEWLGGCCRRCLVGACVRSGRCRWLIDKNAAQNTRISRGVCHGNCYQLEYPKMDKSHLVRPVILASLAIEGKQLVNYFVYCFLSFSI